MWNVPYFMPRGSPSLQLYEGGLVGKDDEYMAFGYWREDPTSPAADYKVGVFAESFQCCCWHSFPFWQISLTTLLSTQRMMGRSVGMYVEQVSQQCRRHARR